VKSVADHNPEPANRPGRSRNNINSKFRKTKLHLSPEARESELCTEDVSTGVYLPCRRDFYWNPAGRDARLWVNPEHRVVLPTVVPNDMN
jgi:hypothetical protein